MAVPPPGSNSNPPDPFSRPSRRSGAIRHVESTLGQSRPTDPDDPDGPRGRSDGPVSHHPIEPVSPIPLAAEDAGPVDAAGLPVVDGGGIAPTGHPGGPGGPGGSDDSGGNPKIRAFGVRKRHEDEWARTPNATGTGAIHVRSFHCKLTDDALFAMDRRINEWLDAHPQYEVKFVNSSIGTLTGKIKEPHLICQVWV